MLTEFTLALSGHSFPNNGVIDIDRIGEGYDTLFGAFLEGALVCHTDDTTCCRGIDNPLGGGQGTWYSPDETVVPSPSDDLAQFYRTRDHMILRLNRRWLGPGRLC